MRSFLLLTISAVGLLTGCQSTHVVSYLSDGLAQELTARSEQSRSKLVFVDHTYTFPERVVVAQDSVAFLTTKEVEWKRDVSRARKDSVLGTTPLVTSSGVSESKLLYRVPTKDVSRIVFIDHMRGAKQGLVIGLVTGATVGALLGAAAANLCIMGPCPRVTAGETAGAAALGAIAVSLPLGTLFGLLGGAAGHAERYVLKRL